MNNILSVFLRAVLAATLYTGLSFNACWASFTLEFENSIQFLKNNITIEHLDKDHFKGTAATTDWTSNKENTTYLLEGIVLWTDPAKYYVELIGS